MAIVVDAQTAHVFVTNGNSDGVSVLDVRTDVVHTVASDQPGETSSLLPAMALDTQSHHVLVAAVDAVHVLDTRTGTLVHTVSLRATPDCMAVTGPSRRVFVGASNMVSVFDARTNNLLNTVQVGQSPLAISADRNAGRVVVASRRDGTIFILDDRTGAIVRHLTTGQDITSLVDDAQTSHVFIAAAGIISVLDARTGDIIRTTAWGGTGIPFVTAVDERTQRVFIVDSRDHIVGVLDALTGRLLRTARVGFWPFALTLDVRRGLAFVLDAFASNVSVLDARDGTRLRTLAIAGQPSAMAVDQSRGHVFIASIGGLAQEPPLWPWVPRTLSHVLSFLPETKARTRVAPPSITVLDENRF